MAEDDQKVVSMYTGTAEGVEQLIPKPIVNPELNAVQRANWLYNSINELINTQGRGLPNSSIIGVLHYCIDDVLAKSRSK